MRSCLIFFVIVSIILFISGCSKYAESIQPVSQFSFQKSQISERELVALSRSVASRYDMRFAVEDIGSSDSTRIIVSATRNSWLYHQALAQGDEAKFLVAYIDDQVLVSIAGPPDNSVVWRVVECWGNEFRKAKIRYDQKILQEPEVDRLNGAECE